MRYTAIYVALVALCWTTTAQAQVRVLFAPEAKARAQVHEDRDLVVSLPVRILRARAASKGYSIDTFRDYIVIGAPANSKPTSVLISTDHGRVIVDLVPSTWEEADSSVQFFAADKGETKPALQDEIAEISASMPRRGRYSISLAPLLGHWRQSGEGYREMTPVLGLSVCARIALSKHYSLSSCGTHLAPTRPLYAPSPCISWNPCEGVLKHVAYAALLDTGVGARTGSRLFAVADARLGVLVRYNGDARLFEYDGMRMTRVHKIHDRDPRIVIAGRADAGLGYNIVSRLELVAVVTVIHTVLDHSIEAIAGGLHVRVQTM